MVIMPTLAAERPYVACSGAAAIFQPEQAAALPPELAQYAAAAVAGGNATGAGGMTGGNAAALAAQLAATGGAAKLLHALAALPKARHAQNPPRLLCVNAEEAAAVLLPRLIWRACMHAVCSTASVSCKAFGKGCLAHKFRQSRGGCAAHAWCRSNRTRLGVAWRLWRNQAALAAATLPWPLSLCSSSRLGLTRVQVGRRSMIQRRAGWCSESPPVMGMRNAHRARSAGLLWNVVCMWDGMSALHAGQKVSR